MKRLFPLFLILALALCACGKEALPVMTVQQSGYTLTLDPNQGTIACGGTTCQYTQEESNGTVSITVTYPDGSLYWTTARTSGYVTTQSYGCSADYDDTRYIPGSVLTDAILAFAPFGSSTDWTRVIFGIVVMALGLFNCVAPRTALYLRTFWKFQDAEPSDLAVGVTAISGGACILLGLFLLLSGI